MTAQGASGGLSPTWRGVLGPALAWLLPALAIAGLVLGAIRLSTSGTSRERGRTLFPEAAGTTSVFETAMDGKPTGLHVALVTGPALLGALPGVPTAFTTADHYDDYRGGGFTVDDTSYLGWQGNRLLSYGFRFHDRFYATTPAQPILLLPMRIGTPWSWKGEAGGEASRARSVLIGYASLKLMGRTIDDCAHFRTTAVSTDSSNTETTDVTDAWDCFGIGTARLRDVSGGHVYTEELVRFTTPGLTLAAPGQPPAASAAAGVEPGSGPGIDPGRSNAVAGAEPPGEGVAWTIDLKNATQVVPAGDGTRLVTADTGGTVSSLDTKTGQVLWRVTVPGPPTPSPVLAGSVVLVGDAAKDLQAFDVETGAVRWTVTLPDLLAAAPAVRGNEAVVVGQDRVVRALSLADGRELWSADLESLTNTPPAIVGDTVVVGQEEGAITAFSLKDGSERWRRSVQGLLAAGPDIGAGLVVAADDSGGVYGFEAATGKLLWNRYVGGTVELPPAIGDGKVVLVEGGRTAVALAATDGRQLWSTPLGAEAGAGPVVLGTHVVVALDEGALAQLSLATGAREKTIELPRPDEAAAAVVDSPLTYFGGNLVVTMTLGLPLPATSIVALPAAPGLLEPHGVVFRESIRRISPPVSLDGPIEPPVLDGSDLFFPGWDKSVWRIPRTGAPVALSKATGISLFAIPAGKVVLLQQGDYLAAVPRGGGTPRWRFPIGSLATGAIPAVGGGLVFEAVQGKGLVALDLATGKPRWLFAHAGPSIAPPLALAGGDVVWGSDTLVRLDGTTGRKLWSVPDVAPLAPLAEDAGVILVAGDSQGAGRLLAIDERTGAVRWLTDPVRAVAMIGPAVGGGIVVMAGADSTIRAFSLASGKPLWTARRVTALAGPPTILGDRLLFAEKGRPEDLNSQDHTITVLDLETGRFLGSLQLPGAGSDNSIAQTFAAAGDDTVVEWGTGSLDYVSLEG